MIHHTMIINLPYNVTEAQYSKLMTTLEEIGVNHIRIPSGPINDAKLHDIKGGASFGVQG